MTALEFRRDFWQHETRVPGLSYGVICVILGFSCFCTVPACVDERTDRHIMTAYTVLA